MRSVLVLGATGRTGAAVMRNRPDRAVNLSIKSRENAADTAKIGLPQPLPFMRSFSPPAIPFGIFILMFSPLKFIECSPPFTATSKGIVTFARASKSSSSPNPPNPPVCVKSLKPLLENPLNLPPLKIFFKISFKFPIPELDAKS